MVINSLSPSAPGTQRDIKEVTYRTHLDVQLKQEFPENVSSSSSMLPNKRWFLEEEENKTQKKKETEYAIKREHIFDKHTAKERDRQTDVCWSAALWIYTPVDVKLYVDCIINDRKRKAVWNIFPVITLNINQQKHLHKISH